MRRLIPALLILLLLPLSLNAAPLISAETADYNFGEVAQGDKVDYTFRFRNSGDELLEISSVSSSCGCTAALLSSKRIAPGDMGEIKATFDSSRFRGQVSKTITLKTNSPTQPQMLFRLHGLVKELLSISTTRLSWTLTAVDTPAESKVLITNQSQEQVALDAPRVTSAQLRASLDRLLLAPGEQATPSVSGSLATGETRLSGYVLVDTDLKAMHQLRLSVSGRLVN